MRRLTKILLFIVIVISAPSVAAEWTPGDPCPTKIHAVIPGFNDDLPFKSYGAVHRAMQNCSNVAELDLAISAGDCEHWPDSYSLPFVLDGSDRYLSSPRVISLSNYEFDHFEWHSIVPPDRPHWSNKDGSWPVSTSSNPVVAWATDMYYRARWHLDKWEYTLAFNIYDPARYSFWRETGKDNRWYEARYLPAERRKKDNVQLWLEAMDFSQVHTLTIRDSGLHPKGSGLYKDLPPALTSLDTLTIHGRWVHWPTELDNWEKAPGPLPKNKWDISPPPRALNFVLALPPSSLTNLTWIESDTCSTAVLDSVLEHHGSSLRHLEWTNPEMGFRPRPTLSTDQIQNLGESAPGLTSLAIDLNRENDDWPREQLKALAENLPNLTDLVIYLNMNDDAASQNRTASITCYDEAVESNVLAKPRLDADGASAMFMLLRESKTGESLRTVTFREGNWVHRPLGWSIWDNDWKEKQRVWATCSMEQGEARCEAVQDGWPCGADFFGEMSGR